MSVYKSSHRGPCFFLSARCRKNRTSRSCSCEGSPSRCRPVCSEEACFYACRFQPGRSKIQHALRTKGLQPISSFCPSHCCAQFLCQRGCEGFPLFYQKQSCSLACQSSFQNSLFTFFLNSVFIRMYGSIQHSCSNSSTLVHTL